MNAFEIEIDHESLAAASAIIADAMLDAIDSAIEAHVPVVQFVAALVAHACVALVDQFGWSPEDIGDRTSHAAAAYVAKHAVLH